MHVDAVILLLLVFKHAIADLALQGSRQPISKLKYFNKGLHAHALDHAILTTIVIIPFNAYMAVICGMIDYIAHYHIDFLKTNILSFFDIKRVNARLYWSAQSIDQIAHYATYALIVVLV